LVPSHAVNEALVLALADQFTAMQNQMLNQFQQTIVMVIQRFGTLQAEQIKVIQQESARIRELAQDLEAIKTELARGARDSARPGKPIAEPGARNHLPQGHGQPVGEPGETGIFSETEAVGALETLIPSDGDIHRWLYQRMEELQKDGQTRWQRILNSLVGK
jgi:hypothetical protein